MLWLILALTTSTLAQEMPRAGVKSCPANFFTHTLIHKAKGNAHDEFKKMVEAHPTKFWTKPTALVELYDLNSHQSVKTAEDESPPLRAGQIVTLKLTLIGQITIPVIFEVLEVNSETMTATFGYAENNMSQGIQHVQFMQKGENVVVEHKTCFKSGREFRDRVLYRPVHSLLINSYYRKLFSAE